MPLRGVWRRLSAMRFAVLVSTVALVECCTQTLEIGLPNRNMGVIRARALAASDPTNSEFGGSFLSFDEVRALTHDPSALEAVVAFIQGQGFQNSTLTVSDDRQWVVVDRVCDAAVWAARIRRKLAMHVDRVHAHGGGRGVDSNDVRHIGAHHQRGLGTVPSAWPPGPPVTTLLTLQDVLKYYNVTSTPTPSSAPMATAAVFEVNKVLYNGQIVERYNPDDLASFQKLSGLPLSPVTHFLGDNVTFGCDSYTCAEPNLDVSLLRGIAPSANFTYWSTDIPDSGDTTAVLTWLTRLSSQRSPSLVQSISWGPPEQGHSLDLLQRMDEEFAKLAARGVTFVTSSGDDGVNSQQTRGHPEECGLSPQYPASSPWVTTVGGTMGPEYSAPERACATNVPNQAATITSGGGFSTAYAQPEYQRAAVASYLARSSASLPPASAFNRSNRAYPDVALQAHNIDTIVNQNLFPGSGTSASAPIFAGMVTLILQARLAQGLPPLGLLNVRLYQAASSSSSPFNDIVVGDNRCTGIYGNPPDHTCCPYGFNATTGWDPVTGLGSVDFMRLYAALTTG